MFPRRGFTRENIGVLIFDLVMWVVTEGVCPLLEYLFFWTWYQSLFEDPLLLKIEILKPSCLISTFCHFCTFLGWKDCSIASKARFSFRNTFVFTWKGFRLPKMWPLQSQSGGIKSEYAFFKFLQSFDFISVCIFFYFQAATLLDLCMLFSPCLVRSRKIKYR